LQAPGASYGVAHQAHQEALARPARNQTHNRDIREWRGLSRSGKFAGLQSQGRYC